MKTGTATTGNDHTTIDTLNEGEDTTSKALAKLYIKCLSERERKKAKMVIIVMKANKKDIKNYISICLLSNIHEVFTKVLTKRLEKTLDENQSREQAGFRTRYSATYHIHVVNQLNEMC